MSFIMLIPIVLIVLFLLIIAAMYNSLVNRRNQVRYSFASIDVQLKNRYDLIPNLVETTKGYMQHERETLEAVIKARQACEAPNASWQTQENLRLATTTLLARAEAYPELKANENFLMLQRNLTECEAQIAAARRAYSASIMDYRNGLQMFPSSMIAGIFNFQDMPDFEIAVAEREPVKVKF